MPIPARHGHCGRAVPLCPSHHLLQLTGLRLVGPEAGRCPMPGMPVGLTGRHRSQGPGEDRS
jgi:hypothetical protein